MNNKIAFFLPTRKGSMRVINKNTRPFAGVEGGLLGNKLSQLCDSSMVDEILVSTNDDECIKIAEKFVNENSKVIIIRRPDELCLDTTNLQDLITYVPTLTNAQHIIWGHVTTPIAGAEEYDNSLKVYLNKREEGYDSLIGVTIFKNFLINSQGKLVNNPTDLPWPRTQDLETLYEINNVMFIADRSAYIEKKNRVGDKPFYHVMDKIQSIDVDWEEDFKIAEMLYEKHSRL